MVGNEDKRNYLRINIPHLKVKYNVLSKDKNAVLPRKRACYQLSPEDEADIEPVFKVILDKLESLEIKVDYLLKWLGKKEGEKPFQYEADVVDISGGGLSCKAGEKLEEDTMLELCITSEVGDTAPIFAIGRVCWTKDDNLVGICFEDIYEEDRQVIMRMIFHAERKLRKEKGHK